jgi:uncharacterized membrane protein
LIIFIRKQFLTGLAVLLPAALTYWIFRYLWQVADSVIVIPLYSILPFEIDHRIAVLLIKTLILTVVFIFLCLLGYATNLLIIRRLIRFAERILFKVPFVNKVYSVIKEILTTFFSKESQKDLFRSAVLIEYPRKGLHAIAFVTKANHTALEQVTGKEMVSLFVPTTPNPTSGVLIFVQKKEIQEIPFSVEEAVKLVISAGTLTGKAAAQGLK